MTAKAPTTRRVWLAGLGGVVATHVTGCASSVEATAPPKAAPPAPKPPAAPPAVEAPAPDAAIEAKPVEDELALPKKINLPPRPAGAETGSKFLERVEGLGRAATDEAIFEAISKGNVPEYERAWVPIEIGDGEGPRAKLNVSCDYLAIGSDDDFIRIPMTPCAAQRIADLVGAVLPTVKLVNIIYEHASAKLPPSYIEGGPTEGTVEDYAVHHEKLERRRRAAGFPLGVLTAGHKKDIVLSTRLEEKADCVAIYGWHKRDGDVIQPLSIVHSRRYADYSHGVRLVGGEMVLDGKPRRVVDVLADPALADVISDEGPLPMTAYPTTLPEYAPSKRKKKRKKSRKSKA
ncbi:MAG: hypothetical protein HOW73_08535 [Polyangiaceae bacterium]|nr:hypothetical protein [Polyangiaceae bacterium]